MRCPLPRFITSLFAVTCLATLPYSQSGLRAQEAEQVTIKLKLFDSNKPKTELIPRSTSLHLRDQTTNQPQLVRSTRIEPVPSEKGFYQIKVPKGRLIETLVISVSSASGANYNPQWSPSSSRRTT
jgi:hypothetical protein